MDLKTDLAKILNELDRRVYRMEQVGTSPAALGGGGNEFDDIVIGPPGSQVFVDVVPPDAPTNLDAVSTSFFDAITADLSWDAPANGKAIDYYVQLEVDDGGWIFDQDFIVLPNNLRVENLSPGTDYRFRVQGRNRIGINGVWSAWFEFTSDSDATIPAQITGVQASRGATTLVVKFDPSAELDVGALKGRYQVQIDTAITFATGNLRNTETTQWVLAFSDLSSEALWYARVRAIDSSGNVGPWSAVTSATAGGVIDSMVVAGLDAAKITFGTMSGDRITTNTLDAVKIKTSTLTAANITISGGSLRVGSPTTNGVLINSQGIRGYTSGAETFVLDQTGSLTVKGLVDASYIVASIFNFVGGDLSDTGGLRFLVNASGYTTNRAINWIDSASPYTQRWRFYAANQSELYLKRVNKSGGQYSSLYIQSDRSYFDNISGSSMGYFYWNGSGSYDHGLSVDGYFTATNKSFVIDHPLDPEGRLLAHACIEGPENAVFYRGSETIGKDGSVTVKLPEYFEALTRAENRTVVVTAIGESETLGASRPLDGSFTVYGPKDTEFFWHVYAERADIEPLTIEYDKEELALADELAKIGALPGQAEEHDDAATPEEHNGPLTSRAEWARSGPRGRGRVLAGTDRKAEP